MVTKKRSRVKTKFISIVANNSLSALDSNGDLWTFLGNRYGWAPMNMTRLSVDEANLARQEKAEEKECYR